MKAHVGVDFDSGIVHSLEATTVKVHDSWVWDELPHGEEKSVWADKGYVSAEREATFSTEGKVWGVMRKASKDSKLDHIDEEINGIIAKVRAKVEHPFRVIKCQFGHVKTRYRGLAKNRRICSRCSRSVTCSPYDDGCRHEDQSVRTCHTRPSGEQNSAEAAKNGLSKAANHSQASASALAKPFIRRPLGPSTTHPGCSQA